VREEKEKERGGKRKGLKKEEDKKEGVKGWESRYE
jgi:hypothetical protein